MNEQFTLDFDRVPLGEKSRLELVITNLTDMESAIKAKIAKFRTRVRLVHIRFSMTQQFYSSLCLQLVVKVRNDIFDK
jgi:hypothetical protein